MKYLLIRYVGYTFLICFLSFESYGQSLNYNVQNYIPPSPTAASLGKFGNIPVGKSNGIPEIKIPIYSYSNPNTGLNLSVSLDYHAGGIRVDDLPSPVGSGWSLKAGGVITRTMRGIYDEMTDAGFLNTSSLPQNEAQGNSPSDVSFRPYNDMAFYELDSQNDIFNYNFLDQSGKFVYGKDNRVLLLNSGNIKIEKFIGPLHGPTAIYTFISKFIITDDRGFKYVFDDAEITLNHSMSTAAAEYTSSWYLSEIVSPSCLDKITFTYEDTHYEYLMGRNASQTLALPGIAGLPAGAPYTAWISSQRIKGKRLQSIKFPNGVTMTLDYSTTERIDPKQSAQNQGDFLLKDIVLSSGRTTRGFKLVHDYSINRPTLKKIIPYGGTPKVEENFYEFIYDIPLPDRLSSQQDHWGFYNSNEGSLLPSEVIEVGINGNYGQYHLIGGGNRDTDPGRCKAGSLKRINYPTGGYTQFEMEVNKAVDPRLNHEISFVEQMYSFNGTTTAYCTSSASTTTTFNFHGDANSQTEFTIKIPSSSSIICEGTCKLYLEIRNSSNQVIDLQSYTPPVGSYSPEYTFTNGTLVPGNTYQIVTYTQGLTNYSTYIDFRWKEMRLENPIEVTRSIGNNELYVGGLRVRSITDYTGSLITPVSVREYEYLLNDNATSSGTLGFYPVYSNKVCYYWGEGGASGEIYEGVCTSPNYISSSSSTIHPLMYSSGSPVAYKRVVEKLMDSNGLSLGRTEYYFKSFEDVPVVILKPFPFVPPEYKEWCNGLLERVEIYNNTNTQPIKKEEYWYSFYEDPFWNDPIKFESLRSVSIAPVKYRNSPNWSEPRYFKANSFYPTAGRADLKEKKITELTSKGIYTVKELNTFHPNYFYLQTHEINNSRGRQMYKKLSYPKDKVDAGQDPTGIYQQMVTSNFTSPIVEEVKYISEVQTELIRANYIAPYPSLFVPHTIESKLGDNASSTLLRYHEYDSRGNPLAVSKENDVKRTYFWGYNNQLAVAEVTNALPSQFYVNNFENEDGNSEVEDSNTGLKSKTDGFTRQLDNIPNGIYILSYWLKSPSVTDEPWSLCVQEITVTSSKYEINISGQLDDLRFYPKDSFISTYTYDPLLGMTSSSDTNNRISYYEYDNLGRLKLIKDSKGNIIRKLEYHQSEN